MRNADACEEEKVTAVARRAPCGSCYSISQSFGFKHGISFMACYIDRAYPFNRLYSDSVAHCISRAGFSNFHDAHRIPHIGIYHLFSSITLSKSHKSRKTWEISAKRAMHSKCIRRCSKQTGEMGSETQRARRYLYTPHCQRV